MDNQTQPINTKKPISWLKIVLLLVFGVVIIFGAILTFNKVRDFVSTWNMTSLPGVALKDPKPTATLAEQKPGEEAIAIETTPTPEPITAASGPTPQPWDGASRVTILILGLDYRDWEAGEGAPRTDTMILLTLDPLTETAGMLSIPRDLWVSIPGFQYGKINTAHRLGEVYNMPGGGPGVAMATVERLLGVPVQYYALIDFSAFERFIDEIGGVKVEVKEKIWVDIIGDDEGKIKLKPGVYTLPGDLALAYARARNTEGADFDRAQRQQQVVLSIRDRILSYELIPLLVTKAPVLYQELSSGIQTNLSLDQAIQLAWLAQKISIENIQHGVISEKQVNFGKSPDGLDILKPLPDQIRLLRDQIFTPSGPISPIAGEGVELVDLMVRENAKILLLNGTLTPGLAGRTSEYLGTIGANVAGIADAEEKPYNYTMIYDYTGNPYTIQYMVELMSISKFRIFSRYTPDSEMDVAIILGDDWVSNNPMP